MSRGFDEPFNFTREIDRGGGIKAELAQQSSRGKRIVAEKSGHYIQIDQPELVIDAIHQVVEAARRL